MKMKIRQLLERKISFWGGICDIGLFWLPDSNEFVTWAINREHENGPDPDHGCCLGHYYPDYESAKKDYDKRN
jgi:hypothetical protein